MEGKREPLAANGKDFSLPLEMTIRESPQSLVTSHQSLEAPHTGSAFNPAQRARLQ